MSPYAARMLNMANLLPGPVRLEVSHAISSADNLALAQDNTAWPSLMLQLEHLERKHERWAGVIRQIALEASKAALVQR